MESPFAALFFKRLLGRSFCTSTSRRPIASASLNFKSPPSRAAGTYSDLKRDADIPNREWSPRKLELPEDRSHEFAKYDMVTSEALREKGRRPKRSKMLLRDFIEDSLYNPTYGYFSSQAVIFNPGEPFDFNSMRNESDFTTALGQRYTSFEDQLDAEKHNDTRQLWHTPTEIFRPHYAEAMARYFVANYKLSLYPYHDLIIYELGAGNGTFMLNVLDYIRDTDPEVYARTKYKIIEISPTLAEMQNSRLRSSADARGHVGKVVIVNQSIFAWNTVITSPCFVVALEVVDNFGHDVVRYDRRTERPLQGQVIIDKDGEIFETFSHRLDPLAARFLRVRDAACSQPVRTPLPRPSLFTALSSRLSSGQQLSEREYIPTRLLQFFDVLQKYFPLHRLLLSDFHALPNAVPGMNAPVVQTRFQRRTVPVSTPLVHQGYFDIFFPTDFRVMEEIYQAVTGRLTTVLAHEDFMQRWAYVDETRTRNGENPLLSWYQNASVMTTV